ncbi:MAG: hypothetical protein A2W99_01565 [Bacteroidetes bacterium GWF2_33_16]|nr:MAG: hypothetical protein A2X00_16590 [Bacteroidetes bacterium GWE2_32_14]OFY06959.1 MAG: hypothetical protein A2W99_01565 [Bacteroidetes bacterium GWF2_33_16]
MNYKSSLERAKSIIINPKAEWESISLENNHYKILIKDYIVYLALIPALVGFIGYSLIGYRVQFVGLATSFTLGLKLFAYYYLVTVISIYIVAWIIQFFAKKFEATQSFNKVFELITYSFTAIITISILNISPAMSRMVSFLNLYCIYIFFFGFRKMIKIKPEKALPFFIFCILVFIIVYFFLWIWLKNEIIINHKSFNI